MGSGVIYYEYEKREKFEDYDLKADAELGTFKIRRYHFDDESFIHPLHSVRFDPDHPYKVPIEALMADQPLSSSDKGRSSARGSHRWMCEGNKEEKETGGIEPSIEKEEASENEEDPEEDPEEEEEEKEEEDPEEKVLASTSLPMDIDAIEDYLQFIEELERHP
ncbi:hypothetical protein PIB30_067522 [Stylosanthes scabra]|uniref:Uncharacterized protein n=1 Tax=Stylosanthes scabra TaxID=79078 RepID=A0ABU6XMC7_9FABA|nr:hypothetical protein [Stylosanthes scabra]